MFIFERIIRPVCISINFLWIWRTLEHILLLGDSNKYSTWNAVPARRHYYWNDTYYYRYLIFLSFLCFSLCFTRQCLLYLMVHLFFTELQAQLSNGTKDAVLGNVCQRTVKTSYYCFIVRTCLIYRKKISKKKNIKISVLLYEFHTDCLGGF